MDAVSLRMRGDVDRAARASLEVGAARVGRLLAPGEAALLRCGGGELPFRLGGQPTIGPATISVGLVRADVDDGLVRRGPASTGNAVAIGGGG